MFVEFIENLTKYLKQIPKIENICEIGTHNGKSAMQMLQVICKLGHQPHYVGYDLFENATIESHTLEDNGKGTGTIKSATERFNKIGNLKFTYEFIKGNTLDTLNTPKRYDFAFIDGGHSYETVKHDYEMLKETPYILLDDSDLDGVEKFVKELKEDSNLEVIDFEPSKGKAMNKAGRKNIHRQTMVIRKNK